jgi:hypothetical protein
LYAESTVKSEFAQIARQYPRQVQHIFIHDVTMEGKKAKRYQKTFKDLPLSLWTVFRDAARLNINKKFTKLLPKMLK